jgi:predicted house-cleaning noncanonical NTP pyrophosphatase (MazG superfamily)
MREKLIDRIIEISKRNNGFSQGLQRWKDKKFKGILLSDLQTAVTAYMNQFTDDDLLVLFEMIVRQDQKQY